MSKNKLTPWGWLRNPRLRNKRDVLIINWRNHARGLAEAWCKPEPPSKTLLNFKRGRGWVEVPISVAEAQDRAKACFSAQDLLVWLDLLDAASAAGHKPLAEYAAFEAGRHYQLIQHRVLAHEERLCNARRGGQTRLKADPAWQSQVEAMMQRNGRSYTDVCAEIGTRSGVDGRTVRRHTQNPRRKK